MLETVAGFDWDEGNLSKCQKHGVSIGEIEMDHSALDDRFIAVRRNEAGRPMFVAFTFRTKDGKRFVGPVSARYMHEKEVKGYEAESS